MKISIKKAVVFVAVIVVVLAVMLQFVKMNSGTQTVYKTEVARYGTKTITESVDGFVVMDDVQLSSDLSGVIVPIASDGTKLGAQGEYALSFESEEQALELDEYNALLAEKEYYSNLKTDSDAYVSDVQVYNANILRAVLDYAEGAENGNYDDCWNASDAARKYLTEKQIVSGKEDVDVSERLESINARLDELSAFGDSSDMNTKGVSCSCYYFSFSDGYEGCTDYASVKDITCGNIDKLMSRNPSSVSDSGKIVKNPIWYFVCSMNRSQTENIEIRSYYDVEFYGAASVTVKMRVEAMNPDEETDKIAVVFSSGEISAEIASLRKVSARICTSSHSGIVFPSSAVRTVYFSEKEFVTDEAGEHVFVNGEYATEYRETPYVGVYILFNNVAKFRRVNIVYMDDEICVAEYVKDNPESYYIKINDEVLTEGVGLSDESIIRSGYFPLNKNELS